MTPPSGKPAPFHDHGPGHGHSHAHPAGPGFDGPPPRLHLRGVVLPEGEQRDLWICDGVIRLEPVADATTIADGAWIMPGLVDAHCHVGLDAKGAVPDERAEEHALLEREAGALLLRDAGSPADTRWIDEREDLPKIIRAGRHIAQPKRYTPNFADEIDPDDLVAAVERQAPRSDGWIKLVGDWIERGVGDLSPLWSREMLTAGIARAHELGCRVTAHHFGEEGLDDLLAAGIDGIEHGTGLRDDTIAMMAERQVSLVPTLINIENFPMFAQSGEEKFPHYAAHMRALYAHRWETYAACLDAGVPIYAGTDAGGVLAHGLIGEEVELLGKLGTPEFALGAASWRAREWLGEPGIADGAPADLVVYEADPRSDLSMVRSPAHIVLRGRVYR